MIEQATEQIGKALGRIPSGCAIITARSTSGSTGMLASWIQQASFDPPTITVALKKGRPIEQLIEESGAFVVNILGENPSAMFKHFGKGFSLGEEAFAGLDTKDVEDGIVIPDQIAWLSAKVLGRHEAADHWVYIAKLSDAGIEEITPPYVHLRKNGLSY
ncbi:MAG: flavin reductase family protein [Phycisphaerales bacterium]|nr:flavin reductase family protein [Phycisphaerales bacterium]